MAGLSSDPRRRGRQLANLKRGANPAPVGNAYRKTHGAYAALVPARVDAKVAEVFAALSDDAPLRAPDGGLPPADGAAVRLAAEALVRLDDIGRYLTERGLLDADGELRTSVLDLERRLRAEAADHLASLGCSPRARVALGVDLVRGVDLAQEMAALAAEEEGGARG